MKTKKTQKWSIASIAIARQIVMEISFMMRSVSSLLLKLSLISLKGALNMRTAAMTKTSTSRMKRDKLKNLGRSLRTYAKKARESLRRWNLTSVMTGWVSWGKDWTVSRPQLKTVWRELISPPRRELALVPTLEPWLASESG